MSRKRTIFNRAKNKTGVITSKREKNFSRSSLYYTLVVNEHKEAIEEEILSIFVDILIYGAKNVHFQLIENGFNVCLNTVQRYRNELGLRAILAVRESLCLT